MSPTGTTNYLYGDAKSIEELDATGTVLARHSQGPGIDQPLSDVVGGAAKFYDADGLGSVTSLADISGSLTDTYVTDSFGKTTTSTGTTRNPYRYTARDLDSETGLYYYRARYYDPGVGRFVTEDPLTFGGGINFYAYVGNRSTNLIDPSGRQSGLVQTVLDWLFKPVPPPPVVQFPPPPAPTPEFRCSVAGECDFAPDMNRALDCFRTCLGRQPIITCGRGRHPQADPHSRGLAVDMGHGTNPWLSRQDAERCYNNCFPRDGSWAEQEWNDDSQTEYQFHFQLTPNLVGDTGFAPGIRPHGH